MRKQIVVLVATCAMVAVGSGAGSAANAGRQIQSRGDVVFRPNQVVKDTLMWHGGNVSVRSGGLLTIMSHDNLPDTPHVFTIVNRNEQPRTLDDLFGGTTCNTCNEALAKHDVNGDQELDAGDLLVVDVGQAGLNEVGDSVAIPEGQSQTVRVTAPAGTTLHFICSIHNEMQGVLRVR